MATRMTLTGIPIDRIMASSPRNVPMVRDEQRLMKNARNRTTRTHSNSVKMASTVERMVSEGSGE